MDKEEQIFLNQPQTDNQRTPENIKYINNSQSADYISQFLLEECSHQFYKQKHQSAPIMLQQIKQTKEEADQNQEVPTNIKKRVKSLFHNFQKHLVITLKNIVKIRQPQNSNIITQIGFQMWQIFLKSHLYTKTILHILFGAEGQQQECLFTSSMLNKFGYVDLFNKYSQEKVRKAQAYLREQTLNSMNKVNIRQYLNRRRMTKIQQFQDYLNEFLEQLSEGPMKKRLPKTKKKNLKSYQKSLNRHKQTAQISRSKLKDNNLMQEEQKKMKFEQIQ